MAALTAVGVFVLMVLSFVCFAAYKIKARRFEFSAAIWKVASLRITILSAAEEIQPARRPEAMDREPA